MKRIFLCLVLLSALFIPLGAQSNEILDRILSEDQISAENAAYLLLSMADGNPPESPARAFSQMSGKYELSAYGIESSTDAVSLGVFSYLLQQELSLPKGVGSTLFPGPRYALRDLKFLNIVQEQGDASSGLSGERALRVLGRALTETEERQ